MSESSQRPINVWEDTVGLKELLIGLAGGAALGFVCYVLSLRVLSNYLAGSAAGVVKGYALMGGICGCVAAAVLVARFVKPRRILCESGVAPADRAALLQTLGLDPDEERRALEKASPKLIREMEQLQIHDLFAEFGRSPGGGE